MKNEELQNILNDFLDRWSIDDIEKMSLDEYVSTGDKDTFCQWVETRTRVLGSIKGMTSIKFGIYRRKKTEKEPKNYKNDSEYSWLRSYGENRDDAFRNIKEDIKKIIKYSELGKFELINDLILPDLFKWKVAFLYSNERLVPIFKREVLLEIAKHFGLEVNKKTKISDIQKIMISNKPAKFDVNEFMWNLYGRFSKKNKEENKQEVEKRRKRKASGKKNINPQQRKGASSYIAEQKHNKIQEALRKILIEEYGEINVSLEENFVDIKVIQPTYINFYEVKSAAYASDCVREALGQILMYSFEDTDPKPKKHIVVGQYPPNQYDSKYIEYLKKNMDFELEYIYVEIE